MNKRRILVASVLVILLLLLGGLLFVYLSLGDDAGPAEPVPVSAGLKHVAFIYGWGSSVDQLLDTPQGVAFRDGLLYVGQANRGEVVVFDEGGTFVRTIGRSGTEPGQLSYPAGIALDGVGNVYVADATSAKIVVYTAEGEFFEEITGIDRPLALELVDDVRLYAATFDSLKTFDVPSGSELSSWGSRGRGEDQYDFPNGLAVADGGDSVYVADGNNTRVKRLDSNGEVVWVVGAPPESMSDSSRVFGLAGGMALVADVLYITDPLRGSIHLYRADGTFVGEVGDMGEAEGQFSYPVDIASMGGNKFAVTEWGNDRVQIVEIDPEAVEREPSQ